VTRSGTVSIREVRVRVMLGLELGLGSEYADFVFFSLSLSFVVSFFLPSRHSLILIITAHPNNHRIIIMTIDQFLVVNKITCKAFGKLVFKLFNKDGNGDLSFEELLISCYNTLR
jgi:hypothetical protein